MFNNLQKKLWFIDVIWSLVFAVIVTTIFYSHYPHWIIFPISFMIASVYPIMMHWIDKLKV